MLYPWIFTVKCSIAFPVISVLVLAFLSTHVSKAGVSLGPSFRPHLFYVSLNDIIHLYGLNLEADEADIGISPFISKVQFVLAVLLVKCHLVSLLGCKDRE